MWTERRKVSKVGTVTLHHNAYEVGHELAGRYVELAFDPLWQSRHKGSYADPSVIPTIVRLAGSG
ncbi:Mu transposase C-terminal domain-containing protein [Nonomuraea sp. M3C6]|uniref:Mu transposase C-terminal domain-containing protein n=1 Tax=Nonomuraea marmarensis TaxID=3351344 RepID=A0ABW7AZA5_9ACTN